MLFYTMQQIQMCSLKESFYQKFHLNLQFYFLVLTNIHLHDKENFLKPRFLKKVVLI